MPNNAMIDLSYLETMSMGDPATMKMILEMTIGQLEEDITTMRQQLDDRNLKGLKDTTHHLKNTVPFVGHTAMQELAASMMKRLEQTPDWKELGGYLEKLEFHLPHVLQALHKELQQRFA